MTSRRWLVILPWALAGFFLLATGAVTSVILAHRADRAMPVARHGMSYATLAAQQPHNGAGGLMRMVLEGQFTGPLQDTIIQRWHDPVDGTVCYIYLPVAVARSAGPAGLVQYGSANIGSLSCFAGPKPSS